MRQLRNSTPALCALLGSLFVSGQASGQSYSYTRIDYGKGFVTSTANLDAADDVVGFAQCCTQPIQQVGFVWHDGAFTTVKPTLFQDVAPNGLAIGNDATSAGFYLYDIKSGHLSDHPRNDTKLFFDFVIASKGFILGYTDSGGRRSPRSYLIQDGVYTPLEDDGKANTDAEAINASGSVVGSFGAQGSGFIYKDGAFTTIDVPGARSTDPRNISEDDIVGGDYQDAAYNTHGFVLQNGSFTLLNAPGASGYTTVVGIGRDGEIAGYFKDASANEHGFIYRAGSYIQIDYPGASSTRLTHINKKGSFIGFSTVGGTYPYFIARCAKAQQRCTQ